ncbi:MAG TPA: redoxin domain-containing protein [Rhodothermales bacterium]|nr:redoxin domain-containing protein [Rhodothermales bacterium]
MNASTLIIFALLLLASGAGLIYATLRGNRPLRPTDAFQWVAVVLSSLLVAVSVFLLALVLQHPDQSIAIGQPPVPGEAALDKPAQNFTFKRVSDDASFNLADYEGKVVLLNFWATWCAPCRDEMPELNRLQKDYGDDGLVVLTVSDEPRDDLLEYQDLMPMQTVSGYLPDVSVLREPFTQMLEVRPTSYIIDRNGIIRRSVVGAGNYDLFSSMIAPYLDKDIARR